MKFQVVFFSYFEGSPIKNLILWTNLILKKKKAFKASLGLFQYEAVTARE